MKYIYLTITIVISLFISSCGPTEEELKQIKEEQRLENLRQQEVRKREARRRDSIQKAEEARVNQLILYQKKATSFETKKKISKSVVYLDSALLIAKGKESDTLIKLKASYLYQLEEFEQAISLFTELIQKDPQRFYYERAKCQNRLGNKQEAVDDLTQAIAYKNSEAKVLYEKINPIRKRVAYYVTRCCDGTTSNSTGRGTCSHHGGVCNWNEPIYEEYRKY